MTSPNLSDLSNTAHKTLATLVASLAVTLTSACGGYNAPPTVTATPASKLVPFGDPIVMTFAKAIKLETLSLAIWQAPSGISEADYPPPGEPLIKGCTVNRPCDGITIEPTTTQGFVVGATVTLDEDTYGELGAAYLLEIEAGLTGTNDAELRNPTWYGYTVGPPRPTTDDDDNDDDSATSDDDDNDDDDSASGDDDDSSTGDDDDDACELPEDPIEIQNGTYTLISTAKVANIDVFLRLILDLRALPNGEFYLVGSQTGWYKEKTVNGALCPRDGREPECLFVQTNQDGFALHTKGRLTKSNGKRLIQTDTFDVKIFTTGFFVDLFSVSMFGEVTTKDGADELSGTLSFERVEITYGSGRPTKVDGGGQAFFARFVPEGDFPAGEWPLVCGDLCGDVTAQCNPPENFPRDGFCECLDEAAAE